MRHRCAVGVLNIVIRILIKSRGGAWACPSKFIAVECRQKALVSGEVNTSIVTTPRLLVIETIVDDMCLSLIDIEMTVMRFVWP